VADPDVRFSLRSAVGIEDFGEQSLVLLCDSLRVREVNGLARRLLALVEAGLTTGEIVRSLVEQSGMPLREAGAQVAEGLRELERHGIVRRVVKLSQERPGEMKESRYLVNPDVSFRQEDDDGGILFNVDTEALEVINPTAVEIWSFLAAPRTLDEVIAHLLAVCDEATEAQVRADVGEFLDSLCKKGFIGVVEQRS